jgi:hypothetical protein
MASECPICCEYYNKTTHSSVSCEYGDCKFTACKKCVRHYLLGTTSDPACMKCKKTWSQNFMVINLNRSFVLNEYKKHRSSMLIDVEISKLPESMLIVERYKRSDKIIEEARSMQAGINKVIAERKLLWDEQRIQTAIINVKISELRTIQDKKYEEAYAVRSDGNEKTNDKKRFIMACPYDKCRGFLSTQYKCGICDRHTCPKCTEVIGLDKNEEHVCKEENIQSTELIKKDTKPCPSCGTRISKIDGCDQMWCTECHNAFNWKTGKIDNGVVHNPHYYQYQRNNSTVMPRAPGDVVCGGLCDYQNMKSLIIKKMIVDTKTEKARSRRDGRERTTTTHKYAYPNLVTELPLLHMTLNHIFHVTLADMRVKITELQDFECERVSYLMNEITKDELEKKVCKSDDTRRKQLELLHIYELFNTVGVETFAALIQSNLIGSEYHKYVAKRMKELHNLREYCNTQFETISVTYNRRTPALTPEWEIVTQFASLKSAKTSL